MAHPFTAELEIATPRRRVLAGRGNPESGGVGHGDPQRKWCLGARLPRRGAMPGAWGPRAPARSDWTPTWQEAYHPYPLHGTRLSRSAGELRCSPAPPIGLNLAWWLHEVGSSLRPLRPRPRIPQRLAPGRAGGAEAVYVVRPSAVHRWCELASIASSPSNHEPDAALPPVAPSSNPEFYRVLSAPENGWPRLGQAASSPRLARRVTVRFGRGRPRRTARAPHRGGKVGPAFLCARKRPR